MSKPTQPSQQNIDATVKQALNDIETLQELIKNAGIDVASIEEEDKTIAKIKKIEGFETFDDEMLLSVIKMSKETDLSR